MLAATTGAVAADLKQVPNQPVVFKVRPYTDLCRLHGIQDMACRNPKLVCRLQGMIPTTHNGFSSAKIMSPPSMSSALRHDL